MNVNAQNTLSQIRIPKISIPNHVLHLGAFVIIFAYLSPYIILGKASHILIFDQLDSMFVDLKILSESGRIFSPPSTTIENLAGGMPRSSFPSPLYIPLWLTYFFGPFYAFVVNQMLLRVVAYCGMYLLLSRHVFEDDANQVPSMCASLAFALLPFYSLFGLSIAGQPLLLFSFLSIRKGEGDAKDWATMILMPFYWMLPLGGLFNLSLLGSVCVYDVVRRRRAAKYGARALLVTSVASIVVEHQLLVSMVSSLQGHESHRVDFKYGTRGVTHAAANFLYGQEHAPSLQSVYIVPTVGIAMMTLLVGGSVALYETRSSAFRMSVGGTVVFALWLGCGLFFFYGVRTLGLYPQPAIPPQFELLRPHVGSFVVLSIAVWAMLVWLTLVTVMPFRHRLGLLIGLVSVIGLISLWFGYWWHVWMIVKKLLPQLPYVDLGRFYYLHSLLWYLAFGVALSVLWHHLPLVGKHLVVGLVALQVLYLFGQSEERLERVTGKPTYEEFFSVSLFEDIDKFIGRDKQEYRVASLGLYPNIAAFNGFHTLDGYHQNYPLEHKRRFRRVIAGELKKSQKYREYFDNYGGRYYVYASELSGLGTDEFLLTKKAVDSYGARIRDLEFNSDAFRAMGGEYLFSAVRIENVEELDLKLLRVFERDASPWRIFVYQVGALESRASKETVFIRSRHAMDGGRNPAGSIRSEGRERMTVARAVEGRRVP